MRNLATLLFAVMSLSGPLRANENDCQGYSAAALIGTWEINQFNELKGTSQIETFEHSPDGRIVMSRHMFHTDGDEQVVEEGTWSVDNCTYIVLTEKVNGDLVQGAEVYLVLEVTPDRFVYKSNRSGQIYSATRVQQ